MEISGKLHGPDALPPGKEPLVPIGKEAGEIYVTMSFIVCILYLILFGRSNQRG
jgi:hypothetical protein